MVQETKIFYNNINTKSIKKVEITKAIALLHNITHRTKY